MSGQDLERDWLLIGWLTHQSLQGAKVPELVEGLAHRLRAESVAVDRINLSHNTLHPQIASTTHLWTPEAGLASDVFDIETAFTSASWQQSPLRALLFLPHDTLRRRLTGPEAMLDFAVLKEFRDAGYTDYHLAKRHFDGHFRPPMPEEKGQAPEASGCLVSYLTRRATGFAPGEIALFDRLLDPLALAVRSAAQEETAQTIARCYIGARAGPMVLEGAIRLGDIASTEAVIWFSDLRGSTRMADRLGRSAFAGLINAFFDATLGAVVKSGGEPLTLMGDGALAIFPVGNMGVDGARHAALTAVAEAERRLEVLNADRAADGEPPLGWGIALHVGTVDYGAIGIPERQSWTVLGPAVNEAARLEALTKELGRTLVASAAFAEGLDPPWTSLGAHELRGIAAPIEVLAPPEPAHQNR